MRISQQAIMTTVGTGAMAAALIIGVKTSANAVQQKNPSFPTVSCSGEWHWVHNHLAGYKSGTLTAHFAIAGTVTITGVLVPGGPTIQYRVTLPSGDTLQSASDSIPVGKLLLSDFPTCTSTSSSGLPSTSSSGLPSTSSSGLPSTSSSGLPSTSSSGLTSASSS